MTTTNTTTEISSYGQQAIDFANKYGVKVIIGSPTYSDVGSFEDFCSEFGYDEDSRKAFKTYKAVFREYEAMRRLFSEEALEEMREIN